MKISNIIDDWEKTNINQKQNFLLKLTVQVLIPIVSILLIIGEIIYAHYTSNDKYLYVIISLLMLFACLSFYCSIWFDKVAPDELLIKLAESEIPQGLKKEISLKILNNEKIHISSLLKLEQRYYVYLNNKEMAEKFYSTNLE